MPGILHSMPGIVLFRTGIRHREASHRMKQIRLNRGFSLVEMVVVMMLLGIIGATVMGRILRDDTYDAIIVRDQVISLGRLAQQHAIGGTDVALVLAPIGNDLAIRVEADESAGPSVIHRSQVSRSAVRLAADVNNPASCASVPGATSLEPGLTMELRFDSLGNVASGQVGVAPLPESPTGLTAISLGARLCVNDAPDLSVCWAPSGYAYIGDCVD